MLRRRALLPALLLTVALTTACASTGAFVWVADLPAAAAADASSHSSDYILKPGDVITIRVFAQDNLTTHGTIRTDGRIAMPMLGEVQPAGKRPRDFGKELEKALSSYLVSPSVTVAVDETPAPTVSILGEVARPGIYKLDQGVGMLQALALCGGFTDFADRSKIFVLRSGSPTRIRFHYEQLVRGQPASIHFTLRTGDVIVVE